MKTSPAFGSRGVLQPSVSELQVCVESTVLWLEIPLCGFFTGELQGIRLYRLISLREYLHTTTSFTDIQCQQKLKASSSNHGHDLLNVLQSLKVRRWCLITIWRPDLLT